MKAENPLLVCWHSTNHGLPVLANALLGLRKRRVGIRRVLYLLQENHSGKLPSQVEGVELELLSLKVPDPTNHEAIYETLRARVLPLIASVAELHINISPGTPAMHAVWMVLHAGGAFPPHSKLWSSQFDPHANATRLDEVRFEITTYLSEIRRIKQLQPGIALYDAQAKSDARNRFFERLHRYASVVGSPLLLLGERGTGKTRLVEAFVTKLKQRHKVVTIPCGGLDSDLAESALFGHIKGAFTGAATDRAGYLREADGGILFLDEVQDLPKSAQRKLVRTLQDRQRRFRPLGSDSECRVNFELVCASNLSLAGLRAQLDTDFFDRISHLLVTVPALRECREDLATDWQAVWSELRRDPKTPEQAPWSQSLGRTLCEHPLNGNLRDLQRLSLLTMAWSGEDALERALLEWRSFDAEDPHPEAEFGEGSRQQHILRFSQRLAKWAKGKHGTWGAAAKVLKCDEKTLRSDASRTLSGP